ncbi:MAG: carboxypeptidase-like regulatory domain-containing protein, partial [Candidatus Izemoplasmatales bacterium]
MTIFSQKTIPIKGTVIDSETKETMVGVNVILNDTAGTTTDVFGNFSLDIYSGKQKLEFRFVGYVSDVRYVQISKGVEN